MRRGWIAAARSVAPARRAALLAGGALFAGGALLAGCEASEAEDGGAPDRVAAVEESSTPENAATTGAMGAPAATPSALAPPSEVPAAQLYITNCSPCHGPQGLGDGPLASSLPIRPANIQEHMDHHTEVELARIILDGIPPGMPGSPIGEEAAARLVQYLLAIPQ